jgi:hypothetical protein
MAVALAALVCLGCADVPGPPPDGAATSALLVSWTFADGRSCPEAGVTVVRVRVGRSDGASASIVYGCLMGLGRAVEAPPVEPGRWTLLVEARGGGGVTLYRAEREVDVPDPAEDALGVVVPLVLGFTGGG